MTESGMVWQQMMLAIPWPLPSSLLSCRIHPQKNLPDVMNYLMFRFRTDFDNFEISASILNLSWPMSLYFRFYILLEAMLPSFY